jgi:hypothetical protein
MQLMHLLMQVVIVVLCISQLLLELNLSSPQDILLMPGFIPLMQHMDKHALTVPVRMGQALLLLLKGKDILHCHLISIDGLIPL